MGIEWESPDGKPEALVQGVYLKDHIGRVYGLVHFHFDSEEGPLDGDLEAEWNYESGQRDEVALEIIFCLLKQRRRIEGRE